MLTPGVVLCCLFVIALSVCLNMRFAARAKSPKHVDDCAGADMLPKKGKVLPASSDTTWNLANPFYAEVEFGAGSDAAAALKGAVLCYTEPSSGSILKATWQENEGLTGVTSNSKIVKYAFNTARPTSARGDERLGTGKGTIIVTQGAQKYLVDGLLDNLTHVHHGKPDKRAHATIWPPASTATTPQIQAATAAPTGANAQWQTDTPFHLRFRYQTTSDVFNFQAAQLIFTSDDSHHTAFWPMTFATDVNTNLFGVPTGFVDLFFRPYSAPLAVSGTRRHLLGTGKGTIIITQNVSGVLVDSTLVFSGNVTQFNLTGP
jgi:hypothetical protein